MKDKENMGNNEELKRLAEGVKHLFEEQRGEFRAEEFEEVSGLLGFHAYKKGGTGQRLKPVAENYLPDIMSTNLQYALEAYEWNTHIPMTEDEVIVSGFWDRSKGEELPEGYGMEDGGRFLRRKGWSADQRK